MLIDSKSVWCERFKQQFSVFRGFAAVFSRDVKTLSFAPGKFESLPRCVLNIERITL